MLDCFRHGKVVQLVHEKGGALGIERASCHVVDEELVRIIHVSGSDVVQPDAPVVRVILPSDGSQVQRLCNCTNAVLCQEKGISNVIFNFTSCVHQHHHKGHASKLG